MTRANIQIVCVLKRLVALLWCAALAGACGRYDFAEVSAGPDADADGESSGAIMAATPITVWIANQLVEVDSTNLLGNLSRTYVLKGNTTGSTTTVYLWGTGYGDKSTPSLQSDFNYYWKGNDAANTALHDMQNVDAVITGSTAAGYFGLARAQVVLVIIAPHGHLDHINNEALTALFDTLGYSRTGARAYMHANDWALATCNQPYCGQVGNMKYYGAPFAAAWTSANLALFTQITASTDCASTGFSFQTPTGVWTIYKDKQKAAGGHTDGTINLINPKAIGPFASIRIKGLSGPDPCPTSEAREFGVH